MADREPASTASVLGSLRSELARKSSFVSLAAPAPGVGGGGYASSPLAGVGSPRGSFLPRT